MVLSKIDANINYLETNSLAKNDEGSENYVYKAKLYNKRVKFVLGNPNFEYSNSNNIVYYNIYLVENVSVSAKIGVYETKNDSYLKLLDNTENINIDKLDKPLLFTYAKSYITTKYISDDDIAFEQSNQSSHNESDNDESDNDESDNDESDNDDVDAIFEKPTIGEPMVLKEQTKKESDIEINSYKSTPSDEWINKFFKSHKYFFQDNEGGGDCFFATLRDALKSTGLDKYKHLSVNNIRAKLAENLEEEQFMAYFTMYNTISGGQKNTQESMKQLKSRHRNLKTMIGGTNNINEKSIMLKEAQENLDIMVGGAKITEEQKELRQHFAFMENITTIENMRDVIKTSKYWADDFAVTTLERLYNVKFIILSENNFEENDTKHSEVVQIHNKVVKCGDADKKIQRLGIFHPDYYIIANHRDGIHYKLIMYDKNIGIGAFTFPVLPYKVKEEVVNACMKENNAGSFSYIQDFKDFATSINLPIGPQKLASLINETKSTLYDDTSVIQIYSKSQHKKLGEGTGESIAIEHKTNLGVLKLKDIPDWRKKLDNAWILTNKDEDKLDIDAKIWPSVQHYLYATRFSNVPEVFVKFTQGNDETYTVSLAKTFYDKKIKEFKSSIISDAEYIKSNPAFLVRALKAKFTNNTTYKNILLLTGKSKIMIYKPSHGPYVATELMMLREELAKK
tara:strand:- start:97 stop:2139 length:2043 start_codon:yes stop_codon:yes gene_type:complete